MNIHVLVLAVVSLCISTSLSVCPNGWVHHNEECFHFSHDKEYWIGAMDICKLMGGYLVEITNAKKGIYISDQVKLRGEDFWTGGSDIPEEGVWQWMTSNQLFIDQPFTNWTQGQPDNNGKDENCMDINAGGLWNDAPCSVARIKYICERQLESPEMIIG